MADYGKLSKLEEKTGYVFKDKELLYHSLIHSSYTNEHGMRRTANNERLEFLGDAVLELSSSDYIYMNYPEKPEGEMTKLRASIVCEPTLAACAREIDLGDFLYMGRGEDAEGGRKRDSILSDALEAFIGAVYLDGGYENANKFILKFIMNDLENKQLFYDSKTILQETIQKRDGELSYRLVREEGPDHAKTYYVEALIDGKVSGRGEGRTKKAAEQRAAYNTLIDMRKRIENVSEKH